MKKGKVYWKNWVYTLVPASCIYFAIYWYIDPKHPQWIEYYLVGWCLVFSLYKFIKHVVHIHFWYKTSHKEDIKEVQEIPKDKHKEKIHSKLYADSKKSDKHNKKKDSLGFDDEEILY
jgi:hypothetical protein